MWRMASGRQVRARARTWYGSGFPQVGLKTFAVPAAVVPGRNPALCSRSAENLALAERESPGRGEFIEGQLYHPLREDERLLGPRSSTTTFTRPSTLRKRTAVP
jgi:hypothetical protein